MSQEPRVQDEWIPVIIPEKGTVLNINRPAMDSMYVLVGNKLMKLDNSRLKAEETRKRKAAKKEQAAMMAELNQARKEVLDPSNRIDWPEDQKSVGIKASD